MSDYIDIVFDGPPGPNTDGHHCNFVEVEAPDGRSVGVGEWVDRGDGMWALRLPFVLPGPPPKIATLPDHVSACRHGGYHWRMAGPCFDSPQEAATFGVRDDAKWAPR